MWWGASKDLGPKWPWPCDALKPNPVFCTYYDIIQPRSGPRLHSTDGVAFRQLGGCGVAQMLRVASHLGNQSVHFCALIRNWIREESLQHRLDLADRQQAFSEAARYGFSLTWWWRKGYDLVHTQSYSCAASRGVEEFEKGKMIWDVQPWVE